MSSWLTKNSVVKRRFPNEIKTTSVSIPSQKEAPKHVLPSIDKYILFQTANELNSIPNNVENLPSIAFTFWEGNELSYLHVLTVQSLAHYNPDMKIIIYSSDVESEVQSTWIAKDNDISITNNLSDINVIQSIQNVQFVKVNMDKYYPGLSKMSCAHKSDVMRIVKLKEHGGIWFDFDILFFRSIPNSLLQLPINNVGMFRYEEHIATGFIFCHPNNPILDCLLSVLYNLLETTPASDYHMIATYMWDVVTSVPIISSHLQWLSNDICYIYKTRNIHSLYYSNKDITTETTIGIYWSNSSSITKTYINQTNFQQLVPSQSVMNKYVHKVMNELNVHEFKETHDESPVKDA